MQALRHRYPGHRIWAVFEPRSTTTRRAVFQERLSDALKAADGVFISQVAKLEQVAEHERVSPQPVVNADHESGHPALYQEDADAIINRILTMLREQDS